MRRAIVTGSSGFVGSALVPRIGVPVLPLPMGGADWVRRLEACDFAGATVFHLAARVHRPGDGDEAAYHEDNVEKTRRLAEAAAGGGAARLVFLSSIKVHGEESAAGHPLRPGDAPNPADPYARSKRDAEAALRDISSGSALSICIVRAPLVYGARARGNLRAMVRLADSPWPLPFASLANRRSFVQVDDLARLLLACGASPAAHGATYLAAHPEPMSTAALVARLRRALGRPERLYAVPAAWLEAGASLIGRRDAMLRLTRSLEADPSLAREQLGWEAQVGPEAAVAELARASRDRGSA